MTSSPDGMAFIMPSLAYGKNLVTLHLFVYAKGREIGLYFTSVYI